MLAAGSQANFFGTPGAIQHAYPLYSIHDAELLRSRILAVLESADRDHSLIAKGALNFVIVGAGPTGTEMAGAFGDMARVGMKKTFEDLAGIQAQIFLVDKGPRCAGRLFRESPDLRRQDARATRGATATRHQRQGSRAMVMWCFPTELTSSPTR